LRNIFNAKINEFEKSDQNTKYSLAIKKTMETSDRAYTQARNMKMIDEFGEHEPLELIQGVPIPKLASLGAVKVSRNIWLMNDMNCIN